jgi:hypothetical protein
MLGHAIANVRHGFLLDDFFLDLSRVGGLIASPRRDRTLSCIAALVASGFGSIVRQQGS